MKVGTKSVLFGAHQFAIHPWFVAAAWWKLYGFPWDPRLWVAFFVHDLGYWGKPNMDGPEGEEHPVLGARIMSGLFDRVGLWQVRVRGADGRDLTVGRWGLLVLLHSRYFAKRLGMKFSRLCVADKLAIAMTPWWLYLPCVAMSGEIHEYLRLAQKAESAHWRPTGYDRRRWYTALQVYMRQWVAEHKDGRNDTWTSSNRHADGAGVWK